MRGVAWNAAASVGQVVITSVMLFVLYRVILDTVGADRLGIWSVVLATASASRIGELGLSASVTRFVAKYRASGEDREAGYAIQTAAISIAGLLITASLLAYPLLDILFHRLFSGTALDEALALLPFALVSFVLTAVAAVFQSGLDGCLRYDRRAVLVVLAQFAFLIAALWLTPRFGLLGLAWAQIGQGALLVIAGWLFLRPLIPGLPWLPRQWRRTSFREMLGYGVQFQIGAIAMMLFDPVTKALLGKFGGLSAAGYFEMASQFVGKARLLIISANQVLVPLVARLGANSSQALGNLYRANLRLIVAFALPLCAVVAAWAPLLSEVWIGRLEPQFVFFVGFLALTMAINIFAGPAFFSNMGTGRIGWTAASQVLMGLANLGLGLLLGPRYGATGVMWAMVISTLTGCALFVFVFHREHKLPFRMLLVEESLGLVAAAVAVVVAVGYVYNATAAEPAMLRFSICVLVPAIVFAPALWLHPDRRRFQAQILAMSGKKEVIE
ncbi:MAG: lipopolysaccharide biosynthesis protein [Panacagrimonas sp.]